MSWISCTAVIVQVLYWWRSALQSICLHCFSVKSIISPGRACSSAKVLMACVAGLGCTQGWAWCTFVPLPTLWWQEGWGAAGLLELPMCAHAGEEGAIHVSPITLRPTIAVLYCNTATWVALSTCLSHLYLKGTCCFLCCVVLCWSPQEFSCGHMDASWLADLLSLGIKYYIPRDNLSSMNVLVFMSLLWVRSEVLDV